VQGNKLHASWIIDSLKLEDGHNLLHFFIITIWYPVFESLVSFQVFNDLLATLGLFIVIEHSFQTNTVNTIYVLTTCHATTSQKLFFAHTLENP